MVKYLPFIFKIYLSVCKITRKKIKFEFFYRGVKATGCTGSVIWQMGKNTANEPDGASYEVQQNPKDDGNTLDKAPCTKLHGFTFRKTVMFI